jgi:exodeoxyribonuclease V beta subunit
MDGERATAGQGRLAQAMAEHNYGLQYWLYTLVLHRYLQMSVEDYDYATHFGGIMYLFVRGMEPSQPGSGVYYDLPDPGILTRLDQCLGLRSQRTEARGQKGGLLASDF